MAAGRVRLMPALMVTIAAVMALKAAALAEEAAGDAPGEAAAKAGDPAQTAPVEAPAAEGEAPEADQCQAGGFAEDAGLSQDEVRVLQTLGERRQALAAREAELSTAGDTLDAAEQRINERVEELKRLEASVKELLGELDEAQEKRIAGLVDVYQRMRAKDAAIVFNGLEDEVMLNVAMRMKQANLAEIMGKMAPERARTLTIMLAERADAAAMINPAPKAP